MPTCIWALRYNTYEVHCMPGVVIIVDAILNNRDDYLGYNHYKHTNSAMYCLMVSIYNIAM